MPRAASRRFGVRLAASAAGPALLLAAWAWPGVWLRLLEPDAVYVAALPLPWLAVAAAGAAVAGLAFAWRPRRALDGPPSCGPAPAWSPVPRRIGLAASLLALGATVAGVNDLRALTPQGLVCGAIAPTIVGWDAVETLHLFLSADPPAHLALDLVVTDSAGGAVRFEAMTAHGGRWLDEAALGRLLHDHLDQVVVGAPGAAERAYMTTHPGDATAATYARLLP